MGVRDSIRAYNNVVHEIDRLKNVDIGEPKKKTYRAHDEYLNNIFIRFGKEHNIKMEKNNSPRYKGDYSPVLSNSRDIIENWELFELWLIKNYPKNKGVT